MANFRQIHVSIWKDGWYSDLEPDEKLLFVYLFSNESTSLSGIYRLTKKIMAFETGIERQRVDEILAKFESDDKVYYQGDTVWIVNMRKFHATKSSKVQTRINDDIAMIPDSEIKRKYIAYNTPNIPYRYHIDTLPQLKEDEKEKEDKNTLDASTAEAKLFIRFNELTKQKPNGSDLMNEKYHKTLSSWAKRNVTPDMITAAIQRAKTGPKKYTISGPWSLDSFITNLLMEREQSHAALEGYTPA